MEPKPPRRKKHARSEPGPTFPILLNHANVPYQFTGVFNGFCVTINKPSEMEKINNMGCFGKANLSRSFPSFNKREINIIQQSQDENRKMLLDKFPSVCQNFTEKIVITVDDYNNDPDEYFKNLKPKKSKQKIPFVETLNLTLEEAFFLSDEKKCLNIVDLKGNPIDENLAWILFCAAQDNFIQNYIVYNYFRSRNWIVKPGLKFGGDFLLYKDGPAFYHASFLVIVDVIKKENEERHKEISRRSMDWLNLICLSRLTETAAKELLIAQVVWPEEVTIEIAKTNKHLFEVRPTLMRRWVSQTERKNYVGTNKRKTNKNGSGNEQQNNSQEKRPCQSKTDSVNKKLKI